MSGHSCASDDHTFQDLERENLKMEYDNILDIRDENKGNLRRKMCVCVSVCISQLAHNPAI